MAGLRILVLIALVIGLEGKSPPHLDEDALLSFIRNNHSAVALLPDMLQEAALQSCENVVLGEVRTELENRHKIALERIRIFSESLTEMEAAILKLTGYINLGTCNWWNATECNPGQHICKSGQCTLPEWVCDGYQDCVDGTDELDCKQSSCSMTAFRCKSICKYIPRSLKCDLVNDCSDGSDEEDCGVSSSPFPIEHTSSTSTQSSSTSSTQSSSTSSTQSSSTLSTQSTSTSSPVSSSSEEDGCKDDEFSCTDGECIHQTLVCNNRSDCNDGSDEEDCPKSSCSKTAFLCKSSCQYIPRSLKCDGVKNCNDGSDEEDCGISSSPLSIGLAADLLHEGDLFGILPPDYIRHTSSTSSTQSTSTSSIQSTSTSSPVSSSSEEVKTVSFDVYANRWIDNKALKFICPSSKYVKVSNRHIYDCCWFLEDGQLRQKTSDQVWENVLKNDTNADTLYHGFHDNFATESDTYIFSETKERAVTYTWTLTTSLSIKMAVSLTLGIPELGFGGEASFETTMGIEEGVGITETNRRTFKEEKRFTVPPGKRAEVTWMTTNQVLLMKWHEDVFLTRYIGVDFPSSVCGHYNWAVHITELSDGKTWHQDGNALRYRCEGVFEGKHSYGSYLVHRECDVNKPEDCKKKSSIIGIYESYPALDDISLRV